MTNRYIWISVKRFNKYPVLAKVPMGSDKLPGVVCTQQTRFEFYPARQEEFA